MLSSHILSGIQKQLKLALFLTVSKETTHHGANRVSLRENGFAARFGHGLGDLGKDPRKQGFVLGRGTSEGRDTLAT